VSERQRHLNQPCQH